MNRLIGLIIFFTSLLGQDLIGQCVGYCNNNVGYYSNNNAATIGYDNMGSSFHSTFAAQPTGYTVWGEDMTNSGNANNFNPVFVNSANYHALTGNVYLVGLGSYAINNVQLIVLTSTGLFASGKPGAVLSTSIKNTHVFSKLTINGKTDGLPSGINPDSVKMLFVTYRSIVITTCGGRVFVLSQDVNMRGNGGGGSATAWSQVMQAPGMPLTNVIAARGVSGVGFALKADSTIWTWGDNVLLGNGFSSYNLNFALQMTKPSGIGGIKMIQATNNSSMNTYPNVSYYLLGTDKKVYSLGANDAGQLGDRTTATRFVWVNALNTNGTVINDAVWISANEHDAIYPNLGVLKTNGNMLTSGNNSVFMIGRTSNSGTNYLDFPTGISSTDTILYAEVGGHTSAYIKKNTIRYGYVGHHVNGSIGNGSVVDNSISSVNFVIPPIINVCGINCDTPRMYKKPYKCFDAQAVFVIKGRTGNKVYFKINSGTTDSIIIGQGDSILVNIPNPSSDIRLQILQVSNALCTLTLNISDTLKRSSTKDTSLSICQGNSISFNGQSISTPGIYKDTLVNSQLCDSFVNLTVLVKDTLKKDSFLSICRNQSIFFNGQIRDSSGIYKDTFINSQGCDSFIYLHLTVNPLPIAHAGINQTRINCNGDSMLLGSLGLPNHSYSWSPNLFLNSNSIAQPWSKTTSSMTYYLTIIDTLTKCENFDTVFITVKESQLTVEDSISHLKCFQDQSGFINLKAQSGFPPYRYKLSERIFQDSGVFNGLSAGLDQYIVQDSKGCQFLKSFNVSEPSAISIDSSFVKNLSCYQSQDGEIKTWSSGGTKPYRPQWNNGIQNASQIANLAAGSYTITIIDLNNCKLDSSFDITEPDSIRIIDTIINRNPCYGNDLGSIEVLIDGGTQPYQYLWSNGGRNSKNSNLKQGNYMLSVSDSKNCIDSFELPLPPDPDSLTFLYKLTTDINCEDYGTIKLKGKGGSPKYIYSIDSGVSFRAENSFRITEAKIYHVQVKDANACLTVDTILVKENEKIEIEVLPKDTTVEIGSAVPLSFIYARGDSNKVQSYSWIPTDGLSCSDCRTPIASPHIPMQYRLEIQYNDNCTHSDIARIRHSEDELFIPNSFSPSGPNIENQTLRIYSKHIFKATLKIFNRWGEQVFESDNAHRIGWDGTYKGEPLKYDVFIYWAEVTYLNGRKAVKSGDVTLIR